MKIKFLCAHRDSNEPTIFTHEPEAYVNATLRVVGIQTVIPDTARIIHGGLSSPVWLEVQGECGIAGGVKIDASTIPT